MALSGFSPAALAQPPEPLFQASVPERPAALEGRSVKAGAPEPFVDWSILPEESAGYTGRDYFALGEESYEMGDFDRAKGHYERALGLLEDESTLARAHERLAFIYAAFGDTDRVYDEFVMSLKLDSSLVLDPDLVSPKVYEAFEKARNEVVRDGILVVNSDPPGADVFLDGESIGEAPARKEHLREGEYTLKIVKTGYESVETAVTIKKDVTLTVDESLIKARGSLTVTTVPPGVQVVFDGRPAGVSPAAIEGVSGGAHTVLLKREYFEPFEAEIELARGEAAAFSAELKRRILVIHTAGQDGDLGFVGDRLAGMKGLHVAMTGIQELRAGMAERGLDPESLGFILERRTKLSLEDAAVLSGIMEDARAELALVVMPLTAAGGAGLGLALYSTASVRGDEATLCAADEAGLAEKFDRFIEMWRDVADPYSTSTGLRLVDREAGGVEVLSATPGYPGLAAGLAAGDLIRKVDGRDVAGKQDFERIIGAGGIHELTFSRGGKELTAKLGSAIAPVEAPVESYEYLYNLALVQFAGYMKNVPAPSDGTVDDTRGLAALNLGNVYQHMGEYEKAVQAYAGARMSQPAGICEGTALFRAGQACEKMGRWPEAAAAYRKAMLMYPHATIETVTGPAVAPLAMDRLKALFELGLVKDRWWL